MSMTETELPFAKVRWWSAWKNLQTVAFTIGWVAGVPAGALGALAWGVWSNQATYASMESKYVLAVASNTALATRVNAIEKVNETWSTERAVIRLAFNDRLTKLEAQISPVVVTSDVIEKYGSHLGALDGRADTMDRNLLAEQKARAEQIANLCAKIVGIAGASGKKVPSCQ